MNYRHAFHAGNFADVFKHWIFCRILAYLKLKDAGFFCLDTHAGPGLCNLSGEAAARTGEWRGGAARLLDAAPPDDIAPLLDPYTGIIRAALLQRGRAQPHYPGSPELAAGLLRKQDFLSLSELHPDDGAALERRFRGNPRVRVSRADGWQALEAQLPPAHRRGIVLIDPPFEKPDEFDSLFEGLAAAQKRWPEGCIALWYPVKETRAEARFINRAASSGIRKILRLDIQVSAPRAKGLSACGMLVVNPPWTLHQEAQRVLPWLAEAMAQDAAASAASRWLTEE